MCGAGVYACVFNPAPNPLWVGQQCKTSWTMSKILVKDLLRGPASAALPTRVQSINRSFFRSLIEDLGLSCQVRPICAQVAPSWVPGGLCWAPSGGSKVDLGTKLGTQIDQKSIKKSITCWIIFSNRFFSIFL